MEPHIQHDPRTKQHIKDTLYNHLYAPVLKAFEKRLEALISQNCLLTKQPHRSFLYKGVTYNRDNTPLPRKGQRLAPALEMDMRDYLQEQKALNTQEIPYVVGYITQVLNATNDLHDYLYLFPESLHQPIQAYIDACPCRTRHLSVEEIQAIQTRNANSIQLIKERMAVNLII